MSPHQICRRITAVYDGVASAIHTSTEARKFVPSRQTSPSQAEISPQCTVHMLACIAAELQIVLDCVFIIERLGRTKAVVSSQATPTTIAIPDVEAFCLVACGLLRLLHRVSILQILGFRFEHQMIKHENHVCRISQRKPIMSLMVTQAQTQNMRVSIAKERLQHPSRTLSWNGLVRNLSQ